MLFLFFVVIPRMHTQLHAEQPSYAALRCCVTFKRMHHTMTAQEVLRVHRLQLLQIRIRFYANA